MSSATCGLQQKKPPISRTLDGDGAPQRLLGIVFVLVHVTSIRLLVACGLQKNHFNTHCAFSGKCVQLDGRTDFASNRSGKPCPSCRVA